MSKAAAAPAAPHSLCASCGDYAYQAPRQRGQFDGGFWQYRATAPLFIGTVPSALDRSQTEVRRFSSDPHAMLTLHVPGGNITADLDLPALESLSAALRDAITDIRALREAHDLGQRRTPVMAATSLNLQAAA